MSRAEAEPPPNRNREEPTLQDFMEWLPNDAEGATLQQLFGLAQDMAQFSSTVNSSGYGQLPGRRVRHIPPITRPQTGHVVFFPVQPPTSLGRALGPQEPEDSAEDALPIPGHPNLIAELLTPGQGLTAEQLRTLTAIQAMPQDALQALLNVPDVPLAQWHLTMRTATAPASRRPARRGPLQAR